MAVYIRDGGSGSGTSWADALDDLPATLTRGETYYVADGTYSGYTFDDAGTSTITIRKATSTDHGTSTGWLSSYGDGQATFGSLVFSTGYYSINGATGGGPGSWNSGYGIKVYSASANYIVTASNTSSITLQHVDIQGPGRTVAIGQRSVYGTGSNLITFSYCRFYDSDKGNIDLVFTNNITVEYCMIGPGGQAIASDPIHKFGISLRSNSNVIIRYNLLEDIPETGYICNVNASAGEAISGLYVYGNVFWETRTRAGTSNSYLVGLQRAETTVSNFKFYNNTIANMYEMSNAGFSWFCTSGSGNVAYNNIWYNNITNTIGFGGMTHDYNYYNNNVRTGVGLISVPETNKQVATGVPFTDMANRNFHLVTATTAGTTLASPYNTDPDGVSRLVDGNWDRGAYEYDSGGSPGDTVSPSVQILTPTTSDRWSKQSTPIGISGTADDNIGVTSVTWSNNLGGSGTATGTTSWVIPSITLYAGDNIITVTAWDAAGNSGTDTITVIYPGTDILYGHAIYIH